MSTKTLAAAFRSWSALSTMESDEATDALELAERSILDHHPTDAEDAAIIIRVLRANAGAGPRSDGRDIGALGRIEHWLSPAGVIALE